MAGSFTFNGFATSTYNIVVNGADTYDVPNRRFDAVKIVGRNGNMILDDGTYPNIDVVYHCTVESDTVGGVNDTLQTFLTAILHVPGYLRLTDSYHPSTYRMAIVKDVIDVSAYRPQSGLPYRTANFDIVFSCRPERFLTSAEAGVTIGTALVNPTGTTAYPKIEITSGTGTLTIGNQVITVNSGVSYPLIIDCELMDAYAVVNGVITSMNQYVQLPVYDIRLYEGSTTVTAAGVAGKIYPRWYTL